MAQHFLLTSAARSLSLATVARMSDEEAHTAFKMVRWSDTKGHPVCPQCGCWKNQSGKRQCVVIMRERNGRSLPYICRSEELSLPVIRDRVTAGSTIFADEASCWDVLHARYLTKRINHSESYSDGEACTNQAESFFSRLRRSEIGIHHHIAGPYLAAYAAEMGWREDSRRVSNGVQYLTVVDAALKHPVSRQWKGYWQRSVS